MSTVRDILSVKGSQVTTITGDATVLDAALLMNKHKIGGLVVVDGGSLCGMVTERDILQRVVAERRDPSTTRVREIWTSDVMCCQPHTNLDEARVVMKEKRIRHLPVVNNDGQLCGLISIGDLNAHDAHSKDITIHLLQEYIYGHATVR